MFRRPWLDLVRTLGRLLSFDPTNDIPFLKAAVLSLALALYTKPAFAACVSSNPRLVERCLIVSGNAVLSADAGVIFTYRERTDRYVVDHAPDSFYELFDPIGDSVIVVGDFEFCPLEHKSDEDPVEYMRSLKHGCVKSAENMKALHLKRGGRAELCKTFDCNHYGIRQ